MIRILIDSSTIKKADMFEYYEKKLGFTITEIDSTYYTIPSQKSFDGMIRKPTKDFEFAVKAHKLLTHEIRDKGTGKLLDDNEVFERFFHAV